MNTRLMIRLIDVALIILLGFIAISRLKTEYVDLPSSGNTKSPKQKPHEASLHIYRNLFKLEDMGRWWQCRTLRKLENMLVNKNNHYTRQKIKLIVTIEPHKSSIMQKLVDVLDICQRNNIEKNLNYESYN
jgi:biopolymer transport protein ExbD